MKILIEAVAYDPQANIKDNTRRQRIIDASAILESFILEYGVDRARTVLVNQGYSPTGNYGSIARQLYDCALKRKAKRESRGAK